MTGTWMSDKELDLCVKYAFLAIAQVKEKTSVRFFYMRIYKGGQRELCMKAW